MPSRFEEIWVFVAENGDSEGGEGLAAVFQPLLGGWIPLVTHKRETMEKMRPMALELAKEHGKTLRLLHFTGREEIEVISGSAS
jgi:hypothetical protein